MRTEKLTTDYLVIGSGAMGMAFVDELLKQDKKATFIIVDKNLRPGGHWNHAYSFVSLHQPSLFYGVNSKRFNTNDSLYATKSEILHYYEEVMRMFKRTGRVTYLSQCEYKGDGNIQSVLAGDLQYTVEYKKIVDATFMETRVPSTTKPCFEHEEGVELAPVNQIALVRKPYDRYVVIGAGKTGIDAILYLVDRGVNPDHIHWVVSSDSWLLCRKTILPSNLLSRQKKILKYVADSQSADDVINFMKEAGMLFQIDENVRPTKFRCATVSQPELKKLRSIKNVYRQGHIKRIDKKGMQMDTLYIDLPSQGTLYLDCTARGLGNHHANVPVFADKKITLQSIFTCQQVLSSAIIAKIESMNKSQGWKNDHSIPIFHPNTAAEYLYIMQFTLMNNIKWMRSFPVWCCRCHLFMMYHVNVVKFLWCTATYFRKVLPDSIEQLRKICENEGVKATRQSGLGRMKKATARKKTVCKTTK